MRYFIAIFCSPFAILLAGRPIAALVNVLLYLAAFGGWMLFFIPGFVIWAVGVLHAWMVISDAKADRRAARMEQAAAQRRNS